MGKQFVVNVHLDKLGASFYGEPAEPKKKVGLWSKLFAVPQAHFLGVYLCIQLPRRALGKNI